MSARRHWRPATLVRGRSGTRQMIYEVLKRGDDLVLADLGPSEANVEVELAVRWLEVEDEPSRTARALLVHILHLADVIARQSGPLDLSNHSSHGLRR